MSVYPGTQWGGFGPARHYPAKATVPGDERDETLVRQWLKTAYPKIRKMAKAQAADIYFGDAAHIRSDHHAGRSWGKRGELRSLRPLAPAMP